MSVVSVQSTIETGMISEVLFIQGGGEGGYEADAALVASLQAALGNTYVVDYPRIQTHEALPDFGWPKQIGELIQAKHDHVMLVAHSLGASMCLKYLLENNVEKVMAGIFLLATPFWSGTEDWVTGLKLKDDFAEALPKVPVYLYHCRDDEEIPVSHLAVYQKQIPNVTIRELETGGHQFNNDLTAVAHDLKSQLAKHLP